MKKLKYVLLLTSRIVGTMLLLCSLLLILIRHYSICPSCPANLLAFYTVITGIVGILLVIPYHQLPLIVFDNKEWIKNTEIRQLVLKIRFRAILFNNLSVAIFFFTILVIIAGFYLLVNPSAGAGTDQYSNLTIRVGASVLLIFLVQVLFRVFKYLLRVAAFYTGKADALEFYILHPELTLEKLIDVFTPEKYDITDLPSSSDNLIELLKAKIGK